MFILLFVFLCPCLWFDDIRLCTERFRSDKAAAICDAYKMFRGIWAKVLVPDEFLSLDETLYLTRVGVAFRQYNKSKPANYVSIFRNLNYAEMPFTYNSVMYLGKPIG